MKYIINWYKLCALRREKMKRDENLHAITFCKQTINMTLNTKNPIKSQVKTLFLFFVHKKLMNKLNQANTKIFHKNSREKFV